LNAEEFAAKTYPLPGAPKPLKVDGSELEYVVLVPKGVKVEVKMIEQTENKDYPMPQKDKPLKVDGSELDAVVLIPKGAEYPEPTEDKAEDKKEESKETVETKTENTEDIDVQKLKDELEEYKKKYAEAVAQLEDIRMKEKKAKVEGVVKTELELGLITPEEKAAETERLMALDDNALHIFMEKISKITTTATPKAKPVEAELEDIELKKKEIRKRLFGHE